MPSIYEELGLQPESKSAQRPTSVYDELGLKPEVPSGVFRRVVGDPAVSLAKGIVGLPEAIVGLADIPTMGAAGKLLEAGGYGFQPKITKDFISTLYSPEQQAANAEAQKAEGFFNTVGAMVRNPSTIANTVIESVPTMLGGAGLARGALTAIPRLSPLVAGALGEGAVTAGQQAEQLRQDSASGFLTPKQAALSASSGAMTGLIGVLGGGLAKRLRVTDIDTLLAGGSVSSQTAKKNILRRVVESAIAEGAFEELPQSATEQAQQNLAANKPLSDGVAEASATGLLAGLVMGGVGGLPGGRRLTRETSGRRLGQDRVPEGTSGSERATPIVTEDLSKATIANTTSDATLAGISSTFRKSELSKEASSATSALPTATQVAVPPRRLWNESEFPTLKAGQSVDGREVINVDKIPNMGSISASVDNPKTLHGIREIPMSEFTLTGKHYATEGQRSIDAVADAIKHSNQITPLIVVRDADGFYILEGATRADALFKLGAKSFPAKVVLDLDSLSGAAETVGAVAGKTSQPNAAPVPPTVEAPQDEAPIKSYTVELLDENGKSIKHGNYKHMLVGQDATSPAEAVRLIKEAYEKQNPGETTNAKVFSENETRAPKTKPAPISSPLVVTAPESQRIADTMTPEAINAELESVRKQIADYPTPKVPADLDAKTALANRVNFLVEALTIQQPKVESPVAASAVEPWNVPVRNELPERVDLPNGFYAERSPLGSVTSYILRDKDGKNRGQLSLEIQPDRWRVFTQIRDVDLYGKGLIRQVLWRISSSGVRLESSDHSSPSATKSWVGLGAKKIGDRYVLEPSRGLTPAEQAEAQQMLAETQEPDIAQTISDKLESLKYRGEGRTSMGILPAVWNTALSIAKVAVKAGDAIAVAVQKAIDYIKANHTGQWDEAGVRAQIEAAVREPDVTTQIQGQKFKVTSATPSPVNRELGVISAQGKFREAGLDTVIGPDGRLHLADGDGWPDRQAEGVRLLQVLNAAVSEMAALAQDGAQPNDRNVSFIDSVRHISERMQSMLDRGEDTAFDQRLVHDLMAVAQGTASEIGRLLQLFDSGERNFVSRLKNVDVELRRALDESYGGGIVRKVLMRAAEHFREFFSDAEITQLTASDSDLGKLFAELLLKSERETGSYVYRMAQAKLKPKIAKTLQWLESDAVRNEAVEQILQNFIQAGGKIPEPKGKKLTAREKMLLLAQPETVAKLDEAIARAVREAERKAAREVIASTNPDQLSQDDLAEWLSLYDERTADPEALGGDPTPEQVDAGFVSPKYSHWKTVRDNLLGYSPVTDTLIRKVVAGDFAGTRFATPSVKPPVIPKIDLVALAKAPDAEVQRVLDAHAANLEAELAGATPFMRGRILRMVREQVEAQLASRRQEFLNNFFEPNLRAPVTASDKLRQLINAGVSRDPRLQSDDRMRQLVRRIFGANLDADQLASLATSTRAEKANWLNVITERLLADEKLLPSQVGQEIADFAEATARTYLAERLQAAEERIVRTFLKGADTSFDRAPLTPEERLSKVEAAKSKLEGVVRAGGIDTTLVENAARKSAIQQFTPNLTEMMKTILSTPFFRHEDAAERFAQQAVDSLNIDAAQRDKLKAVFLAAFKQKMGAAAQRAVEKARDALTPKEQNDIPTKKLLWRRLLDLANAKGFDTYDVLRAVATEEGWHITEADLASMRELAEREQKLRVELPDETLRRMGLAREQVAAYEATGQGLTPEQAATLEDEKLFQEQGTSIERNDIHHRMVSLWGKMTKPFGVATHEARRNLVRAKNDFSVINILTRWTFVTVQSIDVATQSLAHTVLTASAHAKLRYASLPEHERGVVPWLAEQAQALGTALSLGRATIGAGPSALWQGLATGRGLPQRIESAETGIQTFDRAAAKAEALLRSPDAADKIKGTLLWVSTEFLFGRRVVASLDIYQTAAGRFKEFGQMLRTYLRTERGFSKLEAETWAKAITGDLQSEIALAATRAPLVLEANGIKQSKSELRVAAWNIVWGRMLERAKRQGLSESEVTDLTDRISKRLQTLSWNRPDRSWIGRVTADPLKAFEEAATYVYFPSAPLTSFGNAMALAIGQKLQYSPFGFLAHAGFFKGSPTAETALDREVIMSKATFGTAVGGLFGLAAATGLIKVILSWPDDKRERDEMAARGLKPGVVLIPLGNGQYFSTSLTAGPLALLSPEIAAGAAIYQVNQRKSKEHAKASEQATKQGLPVPPMESWGAKDVLHVAGVVAKDLLQGTRSVSGKMSALSDYGDIVSNKAIAGWISAQIPFAPLHQNTMQIAGVDIDPKMPGAFWDMVFPSPASGSQRVNVFGERISETRDAGNILAMFTRGTGNIVNDDDLKKTTAYANLFSSGYTVPAFQPAKGYSINGVFRPMNEAEFQKYSVARGTVFQQELSALGSLDGLSSADRWSAVQAAYKRSNTQALTEVGVTVREPDATRQTVYPARRTTGFRTSFGRTRTRRLGYGRSRIRTRRLGLRTRRRRLGRRTVRL